MMSNTAVNEEQLRRAEPVDKAPRQIHQQSLVGRTTKGAVLPVKYRKLFDSSV